MSWLSKNLGFDANRSKYRSDQESALKKVGDTASGFQTQAGIGSGLYKQFAPQRTVAGQSLLDRQLAGYDAGGYEKKRLLGRIGTGFAGAAAKARANSAATGSNPSAVLALMDAQKASATVAAQNQYAEHKNAMDMQYAKDALGTASGLTGMGMGEEGNALTRLGGIYSQQAGAYGQMAEQEEAAQRARQERLMQLIQAGASAAGGATGGVRRRPAPNALSSERGLPSSYSDAPLSSFDMPGVTSGSVGSGSGFVPQFSQPTAGVTTDYAGRRIRQNPNPWMYRG